MPSDLPLVSVVMPAYNTEKWIAQTLASATTQTYSLLDIVVVDDGSSDQTPAIVERAARDDSRIRLIRKENAGVAAARNLGIAQSRGDLIAPLDADDLWHPEKIARQVNVMQSSSHEVGLVYCWTVEIDEDDRIIPPIRNGPIATGKILTEVVAQAGIITSGANPLIRRTYLEAVGGYPVGAEPCEDWGLQLNLAEVCEFAVVPEHLVGYRRTSGSASKNVRKMARSMENISRSVRERWPNISGEIEKQMIYNRNGYLAHLALTNNQFADAARYKLQSLKACPRALISPHTVEFGVRLLSRMAGFRRRRLFPRSTLTAFKDLHADAKVLR
jgi:glycosyltransferase involved in cell wall biosynthesis